MFCPLVHANSAFAHKVDFPALFRTVGSSGIRLVRHTLILPPPLTKCDELLKQKCIQTVWKGVLIKFKRRLMQSNLSSVL